MKEEKNRSVLLEALAKFLNDHQPIETLTRERHKRGAKTGYLVFAIDEDNGRPIGRTWMRGNEGAIQYWVLKSLAMNKELRESLYKMVDFALTQLNEEEGGSDGGDK